MSTNNFINDKNGVFILPVDDNEPQLEFDIEVQDWFSNLDYLLDKKGWSLDWDYGDDIAGEKKVYDDKGLIAGSIELQDGYYTGAQAIFRTGLDLASEDEDYQFDKEITWENDHEYLGIDYYNYSRKFTYAKKCLMKVTKQLVKLGNYSNGSAVYELA